MLAIFTCNVTIIFIRPQILKMSITFRKFEKNEKSIINITYAYTYINFFYVES